MATKDDGPPVSVRLGKQLQRVISLIAGQHNQTQSDVVRDRMQSILSENAGQTARIADLLGKPVATIERIRAVLEADDYRPLVRDDLGFLMVSWHQAYLTARSGSFANPTYFHVAMDITRELFAAGKKEGVNLDMAFYRSRMNIDKPEADGIDRDDEEVQRIHLQFQNNPNASWAEMCLRPMCLMASLLPEFSAKALDDIFTRVRLLTLLPLAVTGARAAPSDASAMKVGERRLTHHFKIGPLDAMVTTPFSLVVDGPCHTYAFHYRSVLAMVSLIEWGVVDQLGTPLSNGFITPTLELQRSAFGGLDLKEAKFILHEDSGYRLVLSWAELQQLVAGLQPLNRRGPGAQEWLRLVCDLRETYGDI